MAGQLAGFPFWQLEFDENGKPSGGTADFPEELSAAALTDLFVFSHGWNNDRPTAMALYSAFFEEVRGVIDNPAVEKRADAVVGVAGVLWPSILFPGDGTPSAVAGGAASLAGDAAAFTLDSELPKIFRDSEQLSKLRELLELIGEQPPDRDALLAFRDKLSQLVSPKASEAAQDDLELRAATIGDDDAWLALLDSMSGPASPVDSQGGAASMGSVFGRLWSGAVNVLRTATYWEMKNRAGVVGTRGLGPLIGAMHAASPNLRVHLLGHSFGARLVSYALAGLPGELSGPASPVKSLFLLQGAFSHFAFSESLPFERARKGDLAGMSQRVDGPLMATHSLKDLAVGNSYPAASIVARQDAADATDLQYRWEAMGHDGAQAVNAASGTLGGIQTAYAFEKGQWLNLDGNEIIVLGDPPSGAHSDIVHPEIAWAALTAAKVASPKNAQTASAGST